MINCIIVDDNKTDRKTIQDIVSQVKHLNVIKSCEKLSEAIELISKKSVDLLFINISSASDGIGKLDDLKQRKPRIIATSNSRDAAHKAYDIDAVDFILKPITAPRIIKSITKALSLKNREESEAGLGDNSFFIKVNKHFVKLEMQDIFLVEALADYVHIYTATKRYTIHSTMKAMEDKLPNKDFVRVHKSYIVRLDQINEVKRDELSVNGKSIRISNTYRRDLMDRLKVI